VFFCSVIQATDSTCAGCSAKKQRGQPFGSGVPPPLMACGRRPESNALSGVEGPESFPSNRRRTSANRTAEPACSSNVTIWYPSRAIPPEPVLHPKCAVQERVILLGCSGLRPDAAQTAE